MFTRPHSGKTTKTSNAAVDESTNVVYLDIIRELVKGRQSDSLSRSQHVSPPRSPRKKIPSIAEFLLDLDVQIGPEGYYIGLTQAFEAEEIAVDTIPFLTDQQFINFGVTILGRQLRLRAEAEKYCRRK